MPRHSFARASVRCSLVRLIGITAGEADRGLIADMLGVCLPVSIYQALGQLPLSCFESFDGLFVHSFHALFQEHAELV